MVSWRIKKMRCQLTWIKTKAYGDTHLKDNQQGTLTSLKKSLEALFLKVLRHMELEILQQLTHFAKEVWMLRKIYFNTNSLPQQKDTLKISTLTPIMRLTLTLKRFTTSQKKTNHFSNKNKQAWKYQTTQLMNKIKTNSQSKQLLRKEHKENGKSL